MVELGRMRCNTLKISLEDQSYSQSDFSPFNVGHAKNLKKKGISI